MTYEQYHKLDIDAYSFGRFLYRGVPLPGKLAKNLIGEEEKEINFFFDENYYFDNNEQKIKSKVFQKINILKEIYIILTRSTKKLNIYVENKELFFLLKRLKQEYITFLEIEYYNERINNKSSQKSKEI